MAAQTGAAKKETYDALVVLLYDELRRRARRQLRGERADSLQPTLLVHEVYERLLSYQMGYVNRDHFLNVAAVAMRRFLIERARRKSADRRGGRQQLLTLDESLGATAADVDPDLLIDIDRALVALAPEQVRMIELRFFAGCTIEETAAAMGINFETAKKRWRVVKVLLLQALSSKPSAS